MTLPRKSNEFAHRHVTVVKHDTALSYDLVALTIPAHEGQLCSGHRVPWCPMLLWSCFLQTAPFLLQKPRGLHCDSPVVRKVSLFTTNTPSIVGYAGSSGQVSCSYQPESVAEGPLIPGRLRHPINGSASIPKGNASASKLRSSLRTRTVLVVDQMIFCRMSNQGPSRSY